MEAKSFQISESELKQLFLSLSVETLLTIFEHNSTVKDKLFDYCLTDRENRVVNAVKQGKIKTVKFLLIDGDNKLNLYMNEAIESSKLEMIQYLIHAGLKLNKTHANNACAVGNLEIIKYLVSVDVYPTTDGLKLAAGKGHLDAVKYLISELNIHADQLTICLAYYQKQQDVVNYFKSTYPNVYNQCNFS